ncbi:leukocyte cysteine proteinase inhibitor 1-like [Engystomops pustulosus]|uniref:leukocyte cysteine proteinase inhibitor 1-like n=1 Tax=Engystomops pustulosus TaxID=76066 RepID=UPI003AFA6F72
MEPTLAGGLSEEKAATKEVQDLCNAVKSEFLKQCGINAEKFVAVRYRTQVVAGTMYYVAMDIGGEQYCHVTILEHLRHTGKKPSLEKVKCGKTKDDCITGS